MSSFQVLMATGLTQRGGREIVTSQLPTPGRPAAGFEPRRVDCERIALSNLRKAP
jgi:hypothetical protein